MVPAAAIARALFVSDLRADAAARAPTCSNRSDVLYDGVEHFRAHRRGRRGGRCDDLSVCPGDAGRRAHGPDLGDQRDLGVRRGRAPARRGGRRDIRGARRRSQGTRSDAPSNGAARGRARPHDHFRFLGFRNDAPRLIPAFDIVAVPSHVEPLGNATLEAMAAGVPVVGSRVGGIPEMVVDGETGRSCRRRIRRLLGRRYRTAWSRPRVGDTRSRPAAAGAGRVTFGLSKPTRGGLRTCTTPCSGRALQLA